MKSLEEQSYISNVVTSDDGTTINYRQMGSGPGVILLHGGMQAAQNFMKLGTDLARFFTVYIPNRRGRGESGSFGNSYGIKKECEDLIALLRKTDTHCVFGLSSGALIALHAALVSNDIHKLAIYEPPLPVDESDLIAWLPRFDREVSQGNLAAAMVTVIKAIGDREFFTHLPRFILTHLLNHFFRTKAVKAGNVPIKALIPTMHFDATLVKDCEGTLLSFKKLNADILLLGGNKSALFLKTALDALERILSHTKRIEFQGIGHLAADDTGKPEIVAHELRLFFQLVLL